MGKDSGKRKKAEVLKQRKKKKPLQGSGSDEDSSSDSGASTSSSGDDRRGSTKAGRSKAARAVAPAAPLTAPKSLTAAAASVGAPRAAAPPAQQAAAAAAPPSAAPASAADQAAATRARADALMARVTAKLAAATDPRKRLALQTKQLKLLPKCTPAPRPAAVAPPPLAKAAAKGGKAAGNRGNKGADVAAGAGASFQFKVQQRTAKTSMAASAVAFGGPQEEARRRQRAQRFGEADGAGAEEDEQVLVESGGYGTSEALEKEYLRLTSLPRPSDVRPPAVLALALRLVKAKWVTKPDYHAAAEQLKSIRQLPGSPAEFEAYGLLYTQATAAARNTLAMELGRVPQQLLGHAFVRHAMDVCAAARSGNYARFVALYDGAPRMSPYIMDRLLGQMRLVALQSTVAAYRPLPVPLEHLAAQMGLETEDEAADLAEGHGAVVDRGARCLDTRLSAARALGPPAPPAEAQPVHRSVASYGRMSYTTASSIAAMRPPCECSSRPSAATKVHTCAAGRLPGSPAEFEAYGLLYTQATAAARNTLAMELGRVPQQLLGHAFVRHAMDVCAAARSGNYARFVALYDGAPRMSPYIMDRLLGQMRLVALQSTVAAYRPLPVPLEHLAAQMGLETEDEAADLAEGHGAVVDRGARCLDTRLSAARALGPPAPPAEAQP
ncbi:Leukocyte receptor cluster member 8 [Tetrabaena socialis]|uniref:Leukocyte receptor cluster member 8 n=1 Tax=Tetrabaena socialis TaxID=47790 RepID=A0A2J8AEI9_9CHLO|nr:Leukocyte receptor cluster member 8 [Tetrabaena socialis]|eukprot:PNH10916.1 Leukocyte receptor cluster member 8 [Tetrabaena socialis]